jgi:hypothetical protein
MSKLRSCFSVAILALGACGDDGGNAQADAAMADAPPDAKEFLDAPPPVYDFTCVGNGMPSSATTTITLSGNVQQVSLAGLMPTFSPVGTAMVTACNAPNNTCMGAGTKSATSAADGTFSIVSINTASAPLNDFIEMSKMGTGAVRTVYTYPASPFVASVSGIPILTFDSSFVTVALPALGCPQNDGSNGMVALAFTDCADMPITDSTNLNISIKQGGTEVAGTSMVNLGDYAQQASGVFLVCNVPPNATTTVGATYNASGTMHTLRAHDVKVVKATTTSTLVRPGW